MKYYDIITKEIANGINIKVVANTSDNCHYPNQYRHRITVRANNRQEVALVLKMMVSKHLDSVLPALRG